MTVGAAASIRPARTEDAAALAAIYRDARQAALPGLVERHDDAGVAGWLATTLMRRHRVLLAESGGIPVGYIGFGRDATRGPMVLHLYLAPERRGQGIGARLLAEAMAELGPRLSLFCIARNHAALRFYRRQGFHVIAGSDGAGTEEGEPDLLLRREQPTNAREESLMSESQPDIRKGLVGVIADVSAVSKVMPETNSLTYRGYAVQDLAENCSFEEVAFLLWNGELPTATELAAFRQEEAANRAISPALLQVIAAFPKEAHPMDAIRTAVSFLGMEDAEAADTGEPATRRKAMRLLAKIPTAIAAAHRAGKGQAAIDPDPKLTFAENFFHLVFGRVPAPEVVKAFDVSLILYAEHGFNASTFTARTVASTGADLHGAVVAGIAALKGPLHGGANEAVMHMLAEIGDPSKAVSWLEGKFDHKALVMGFGHRVYKNGDSRVPTMTKYAEKMAEVVGDRRWMEMSRLLAGEMLTKKNIHPNLDFPAGPAYHLMGFDIPLFTPIFVASRITGWAAHVIEQGADNRLIRPLSHYTGQAQRSVPALSDRG
jgi:2-methylcitrate synthase